MSTQPASYYSLMTRATENFTRALFTGMLDFPEFLSMMRKTTDDANSEEEMQVGGHWSTWIINYAWCCHVGPSVWLSDSRVWKYENARFRGRSMINWLCVCVWGRRGMYALLVTLFSFMYSICRTVLVESMTFSLINFYVKFKLRKHFVFLIATVTVTSPKKSCASSWWILEKSSLMKKLTR